MSNSFYHQQVGKSLYVIEMTATLEMGRLTFQVTNTRPTNRIILVDSRKDENARSMPRKIDFKFQKFGITYVGPGSF